MLEENIRFGCINTKTGQTQEGYIKDGKMAFKPLKWWQKLFCIEPTDEEYLGVLTLTKTVIFSKNSAKVEGALYRQFNTLTNKTKRLYCKAEDRVIELDIGAWESDKKFIAV